MLNKLTPKTLLVVGLVVGYHIGRNYQVGFVFTKDGK